MNWKLLLCFSSILITNRSLAQSNIKVYDNDSTLSNAFVTELCSAARNKAGNEEIGPSRLEKLINLAAGTNYNEQDQPYLSLKWHSKYGQQCYCGETDYFQRGDILRQVVQSNYRDFANIIGPNNRLSLNLQIKDPYDSLTILEYVNQKRISLEKKYNNKRFEFQQDEDWRNIMFFYFLFSEFSIN